MLQFSLVTYRVIILKIEFINLSLRNSTVKVIQYTFPEFLNYTKTGVTHFCGKKASDSNTLSASLLIFKISHPLEKEEVYFLTWESYGQTLIKRALVLLCLVFKKL